MKRLLWGSPRSPKAPPSVSYSRSPSSASSTSDVFVVTYSDNNKEHPDVPPRGFREEDGELNYKVTHVTELVMRNQRKTDDDEVVVDEEHDGIPVKSHKNSPTIESYDIIASPLMESDDGYDSDSSELLDTEYYEEARVLEVLTTEAVTCSKDGKVVGPRKRFSSYFVHRIRRTSQLDKDGYMSRRTMTE